MVPAGIPPTGSFDVWSVLGLMTALAAAVGAAVGALDARMAGRRTRSARELEPTGTETKEHERTAA